jgi:hypothetical protein
MDLPISAAIPRRRRQLYFAAYGVVGLICLGIGAFLETSIYYRAHAGGSVNIGGMFFTAGLCGLIAIAPLAVMLGYASEIVREFSYDGEFLRFTTLLASSAQVQPSSEILEVRKGGARSPGIGGGGYWISFRNNQHIYFERGMTDEVSAMLDRLRPRIEVSGR